MADGTTIWLTKNARNLIKKYCDIHRTSLAGFMEKIACMISCGMELCTQDVDIETLRKYYEYSDFLLCADVRKLTEPQPAGENRITLD